MQFKFLTALLLVGACLTQVSLAQSNTDIKQTSYVEDLINQAKTAIEQLTNFMREIINDALKVFQQLKEEVKSIANEAIASAEILLNNVFVDAQEQIQKIAGKAKGLGIDISACIIGESQFQQLFKDFLNSEKQCVQKEIDNVIRIINESVEIISDETRNLPGKLWECGSGFRSVGCINGVIWEAAMSETQLPVNIAKMIAEATSYVTGLPIRLDICAVTQVTGAGIETAKLVAAVAQCAAEAIGDNTKN